MTCYDLGLAWNWEYDADLVALLEDACRANGLSLLQITPANLEHLSAALARGQIGWRAFFDRASDSDARFMPVVQWARDQAVYCINPHERAARTWNKVAMHYALIGAGLYTPYTLILPSHQEQPALAGVDLSPLGANFAIKPAHGGGGEGVIVEATSLQQVLAARQEYPADQYLLQAHVASVQLDARPAWFRTIYCAGQVYPCWWDTQTHVYSPVTPEKEARHALGPLREITEAIARLCELDLFSTEISLTPDGLFVVVDYVNDQLDLRLQSQAYDGVPDAIVHDIVHRLAGLVIAHCAFTATHGLERK